MKQILLSILLVGSLVGCSSLQLQKAKTIVVSIAAGAKKAVVTGCEKLPAVEVDIALVEKFVPPGSTTTAVEVGITAGEVVANDLCAKVAAIQAAQAVPVVPVVPIK